MPPSDATLLEPDALTADALAAASIEDLGAHRRRRGVAGGAVAAAIGALVVLVAMFVMTDVNSAWRGAWAVAGLGVLWYGVQQLGVARFGKRFELGLWVALAWILLVVVLAIAADILPIDGIDEPDGTARKARPALELDEPLGRDSFGRSILSRCIYGARVSIMVGALSAFLGMIGGAALGLLAGYFRGRVDSVVSTITNAMLAFPPLILLLALISVRKPSVTTLAVALAVLTVPTFARLTRAQTLVIVQREFVLAARAVGARHLRILRREIVPNIALPIASYAFLVVAIVIVAEGSLSFLGLGIPPPRPSWGGMITAGRPDMREDPHLVFVPAAWMFFTVLSLNRIGDWARTRVSGREAKV